MELPKGLDIHTKTAAEMYGVPYSEVTTEQRTKAKEHRFAEIYNTGPTGKIPDVNWDNVQKIADKYRAENPPLCTSCGEPYKLEVCARCYTD